MLHIVTNPRSPRSADEQAWEACKGGARWIQVRGQDLPEAEYQRQARAVVQVARRFEARCIVGGSLDIAQASQAHGVHLEADSVLADPQIIRRARRYLGQQATIGATADTAHGVVGLVEAGVNYVALAPYRIIAANQEQPGGLGELGVLAVCHEAASQLRSCPVLVVGGVQIADIELILRAGASGVGIGRAIVDSQDISAGTEQALEVLGRISV